MKCEEVVEWMHRYLDHDLGEAETTQMLEHVAKCPECAENFSMLRALSRELEDLPQVSPKFSLVDAIMPQLDAIDEARKEQSSTVQEMSPVPAAFESLQRSSSSEQRTRTKWFNSMAGRMSVGAAAAAVILGFAIWGHQPEQIENADTMMLRSSGATQEANNDAQSPRSTDQNNDRADATNRTGGSATAPDPSKEPVAEGPTQPSADQPDESNGTEPKAPDASNNQQSANPPTKGAASQDKGKQEASSDSSSGPAKNQKSMNPDQGTEQKKPATDDGNASSSNKKDERSASDSNEQLDETFSAQTIIPNQDAPAQGSEADHSGNGTESSAGGHQDLMSPEQGITAQTTTKEWKSPDGSYVVMLMGDQLSIYTKSAKDQDVLNLIEQRKIEGTLKSGTWSKDGHQFSYEMDKDGTTTKDTFKVSTSSNVPPAE